MITPEKNKIGDIDYRINLLYDECYYISNGIDGGSGGRGIVRPLSALQLVNGLLPLKFRLVTYSGVVNNNDINQSLNTNIPTIYRGSSVSSDDTIFINLNTVRYEVEQIVYELT
jgi:hypothetical protein